MWTDDFAEIKSLCSMWSEAVNMKQFNLFEKKIEKKQEKSCDKIPECYMKYIINSDVCGYCSYALPCMADSSKKK